MCTYDQYHIRRMNIPNEISGTSSMSQIRSHGQSGRENILQHGFGRGITVLVSW